LAFASLLATLLVPLSSAPGKEVFTGPVQARVLAVIDGDTLSVAARVWLGQEIAIRVRLAGVDAPEIKGDCAHERRLALEAKHFLEALAGIPVVLHDIRYGKYAGRVLARVETAAGDDLGAALLAAGHARAYQGGRRRGWCVAYTGTAPKAAERAAR
jgi:endonuclease YncB( thermonuclease family)